MKVSCTRCTAFAISSVRGNTSKATQFNISSHKKLNKINNIIFRTLYHLNREQLRSIKTRKKLDIGKKKNLR